MGRLTKQFETDFGHLGHKDCYGACAMCDVVDFCNMVEEMLIKLAHYEDLEEQGRLIELPCKVGDTVYMPNEKFPAEIEGIRITPQGTFVEYVQYDKGYEETEVWDEGSFCIEEISKSVFLTKEEAEEKLKEMRGAK